MPASLRSIKGAVPWGKSTRNAMSSHKMKSGGDFDCLLVSGEEKGVLGLVGLEPTILPLWAVRFNQLNYKPLRISTCNSLASGRVDGKRRPLLYLLLPLPRNEQLDKKIIFFFVCIYIIIRKLRLSKRPFRDSNCRYAFRLATTQTGGGYLFACKAGCSPFGFGKGSPIWFKRRY